MLMPAPSVPFTATRCAGNRFAIKYRAMPTKQRLGTPEKRRVIIDTDPGIDDAVALFLAMRSPELQIDAITTVAGNKPLDMTLSNALRVVEIAGRSDIPVAAGASGPLVRRLVTSTEAHGENGLGDVEFPEPKLKPHPQTAVQLIRRFARESPGEISIITLGPLTNLALA